MRVINLDETGIKVIASTKRNIYLSISEIRDFLKHKYTLKDNTLSICNKSLPLSDNDVQEFPNVFDYIKAHFSEKVK